ncbi:hypothetical protein E2C01_012971 [Portunus trituberculatus]|uniref:Uncharacterized protein n=1 Tax=Portunus trituberculatus TaxID=210409 RepID=A0A5B7DF32_PORTR|nr:hypothetical protein [Portunus trituberculatus]
MDSKPLCQTGEGLEMSMGMSKILTHHLQAEAHLDTPTEEAHKNISTMKAHMKTHETHMKTHK